VLLDPQRISKGDKAILAGLYLSRFNDLGLRRLGFDGFTEAFNVLGYAIGSPRSSIKNYRDEFDPLFSNPRKGWHKRPRRENCLKVFEEYKNIGFELFTDLIRSFAAKSEDTGGNTPEERDGEGDSQFARRLITGLAAERYFEMVHKDLPEFHDHVLENTTQLACGYDYRLQTGQSDRFLAVEVKGLRGKIGSLSLTPREYAVAGLLPDRFFCSWSKTFKRSHSTIFSGIPCPAVSTSGESNGRLCRPRGLSVCSGDPAGWRGVGWGGRILGPIDRDSVRQSINLVV